MLARLRCRAFAQAWRLGQWSEQRLTPLGRWAAGGTLAAGAFAVDVRNTLAFQLAALLALLLTCALVGNRRLRAPLRAWRELPALATVGVPLRYRVLLEHAGKGERAGLLLREELEGRLPEPAEFAAAPEADAETNWFDRVVGFPRWLELLRREAGADTRCLPLPALPAAAPVAVESTLLPLRRGYLRFGALSVLRPDLFGLSLAPCRLPVRQSLLVLPRIYPVPPLAFPGRRTHHPAGLANVGGVGDSQEFHALRPYRPGDPLRRLHFPSWARTGTPHVKDYQDEYFDRQALLLDTFAGPARAACFEEAVSLTASCALAGSAPDRLLDLLFVGARPVRLTAGRGLGELPQLLEALACARLTPGQPFSALAELALAYAAQMSALLMVLLEFDADRRALVERLRAAGVAVRVLWVSAASEAAADSEALAATDGDFHVLRTGRVPEDLHAALAGRNGARR